MNEKQRYPRKSGYRCFCCMRVILVEMQVNIIYSVTICNVYIKQVIHILHRFLHRLGRENG